MPSPGARPGVTKEGVRVLSWLLRNSGQLGDMHDSDSRRGLYVSAVDLIALGLTYSSAIRAANADNAHCDTNLKHLSLCIGAAVKMVSFALLAAGGAGDSTKDATGGQGGAREVAEAEDLRDSLLDVLCWGWTTSPLEMLLEGARIRALTVLLKYAALPGELELSANALHLILILCKSTARNDQLVDAFLNDCSAEERCKITRGLANWLKLSVEGADAIVFDLAAAVLRILLRSLDTLHELAGKNACNPWDVVSNNTKFFSSIFFLSAHSRFTG
jgi:hypothetical protein